MTPMNIPNRARRTPEAARLFITIPVQTTPEIKLPTIPKTPARNPISRAKAIKQQTGGANNTTKNFCHSTGAG
jgi:hypothetical protein